MKRLLLLALFAAALLLAAGCGSVNITAQEAPSSATAAETLLAEVSNARIFTARPLP